MKKVKFKLFINFLTICLFVTNCTSGYGLTTNDEYSKDIRIQGSSFSGSLSLELSKSTVSNNSLINLLDEVQGLNITDLSTCSNFIVGFKSAEKGNRDQLYQGIKSGSSWSLQVKQVILDYKYIVNGMITCNGKTYTSVGLKTFELNATRNDLDATSKKLTFNFNEEIPKNTLSFRLSNKKYHSYNKSEYLFTVYNPDSLSNLKYYFDAGTYMNELGDLNSNKIQTVSFILDYSMNFDRTDIPVKVSIKELSTRLLYQETFLVKPADSASELKVSFAPNVVLKKNVSGPIQQRKVTFEAKVYKKNSSSSFDYKWVWFEDKSSTDTASTALTNINKANTTIKSVNPVGLIGVAVSEKKSKLATVLFYKVDEKIILATGI